MPRKHDTPHQQPTEERAPERTDSPQSSEALARLLDAGDSASLKALSLQKNAGNRAVLEALKAAEVESDGESEEINDSPDQQEKSPETNDLEFKKTPNEAPKRAVRKRLDSVGTNESHWELLLGGDDAPPPARRPNRPRGSLRRRLRALSALSSASQGPPDEPEEAIEDPPVRPIRPPTGHRQFYALEPALTHPKRWINPDPSPESLGQLPKTHPLLLIQAGLTFWAEQASSALTSALVQWAQQEPQPVGHLQQTVRGLGLLLLVQQLESEQLGATLSADATALLLQQNTLRAVQKLDEQASAILSTPELLRGLLSENNQAPEAPEASPDASRAGSPVLRNALRKALPLAPLPAIKTPYIAPKPDAESGLEDLETAFQSLWEPSDQRASIDSIAESAELLLAACGERRIGYAAQAAALQRCRGNHTLPGLLAALQSADKSLRGLAQTAHRIGIVLDACESDSEALPHHRDLLDLRERLLALDTVTEEALIRAASPASPQGAPSPTAESVPEFLLAELQTSLHSPLEIPPIEAVQALPPLQRLAWSWCRSERGEPQPKLQALLQETDNPWLEIRRRLDAGEATPDTQSPLLPWAKDPLVMGLWSACIEEACMEASRKR